MGGSETNTSARGLLAAFAGVLVISPDTLLIRLIETDTWTLVCVRGALSGVGLCFILIAVSRRSGVPLRTIIGVAGVPGIGVALFSAAANFLFVYAIGHTTVANALVIFTAMPLLAAIMSRVILGEQVSRETWWASSVALGAIVLIFSTSLSRTGLSGDFAAFGATCFAAANIVITRRYRTATMLPGIAAAGLISAIVLLAFADFSSVTAEGLLFLTLDGFIVIPIALSLLIVAPRYVAAPTVALIYLLETVLGPLWVWLVLDEVPPTVTIVAGVALLAVIAAHSSAEAVRQRGQPA